MAQKDQGNENITENTHLRRAADLIASKFRKDGEKRAPMQITCEILEVNYSTWLQYVTGRVKVPIELAKKIDALGYPKHLLRPDVWEE